MENNQQNQSYRVFTINSGSITEGAPVQMVKIAQGTVEIFAVTVGESGRGRQLGMVPVDRPPHTACSNRNREMSGEKCDKCGVALENGKHPDKGEVPGRLMFAELGQTKSGKPKLFSKPSATSDEKVIAVFSTMIGFRGGNSHTGDRAGWTCSCGESADTARPEKCPKCGGTEGLKNKFAQFPGEIICQGTIAEGDAGRMGSGEQLVAFMPKDVVFRTSYSGRLYGKPGAHYYKWTGEKFLAATWEDRSAADLF
ncbi:MAG: hypothetical protein HYW65_02910 [Candidatus Liptonbacteria bacterium]|nr:hypothetical protein [Candidatus Liptonbacteria bacterium]